MAQTLKWTALGTVTTYLTTELNALANGANVIGAAIDNTATLNTCLALELNLAAQGSARSAGAYVAVYIVKSVDGTNYGYGGVGLNPAATDWVANFVLDAATTARYATLVGIQIPPCKFMILVQNNTGQAFAATGTTLKYAVYDMQAA